MFINNENSKEAFVEISKIANNILIVLRSKNGQSFIKSTSRQFNFIFHYQID